MVGTHGRVRWDVQITKATGSMPGAFRDGWRAGSAGHEAGMYTVGGEECDEQELGIVKNFYGNTATKY